MAPCLTPTAFCFTPTVTDWARIAPELVVAATALIVLLADLVVPARRHAWLAFIGLAASVLGMFYYLRVIWAMYFAEGPAALTAGSRAASAGTAGVATRARVAPALAATGAGVVPAGGAAVAVAPVVASSTASSSAAAVAAPATRTAEAPAVAPAVAPAPTSVAWPAGLAVAIATILTIVLGIIPGPLFTFALRAVGTLLR